MTSPAKFAGAKSWLAPPLIVVAGVSELRGGSTLQVAGVALDVRGREGEEEASALVRPRVVGIRYALLSSSAPVPPERIDDSRFSTKDGAEVRDAAPLRPLPPPRPPPLRYAVLFLLLPLPLPVPGPVRGPFLRSSRISGVMLPLHSSIDWRSQKNILDFSLPMPRTGRSFGEVKAEKRMYQPVISGASKVRRRWKMGSEGDEAKEEKLRTREGVEDGSGGSAGGKFGIVQRLMV